MDRGPSCPISKSLMKPSSLSTLAIATLILEDGMRTVSCLAETPLRIRVSMSAMGSDIVMFAPSLPAGLRHAGDLSLQRELTEANAAHREHADVATRPAAQPAAVAFPRRELRRPVRLDDHRNLRHGLFSLLP